MSPEARLIDWFEGETELEGQSSARCFTTGNRSMVLLRLSWSHRTPSFGDGVQGENRCTEGSTP